MIKELRKYCRFYAARPYLDLALCGTMVLISVASIVPVILREDTSSGFALVLLMALVGLTGVALVALAGSPARQGSQAWAEEFMERALEKEAWEAVRERYGLEFYPGDRSFANAVSLLDRGREPDDIRQLPGLIGAIQEAAAMQAEVADQMQEVRALAVGAPAFPRDYTYIWTEVPAGQDPLLLLHREETRATMPGDPDYTYTRTGEVGNAVWDGATSQAMICTTEGGPYVPFSGCMADDRHTEAPVP